MKLELTSVAPQQCNIDRRTDNMELIALRELIVLTTGDCAKVFDHQGESLHSLATLRIYSARTREASRRIANFWLHIPSRMRSESVYAHASGIAQGYGYCRQSAAADCAMRAAGLKFSVDLHGAGMGSIDSALEAIARFYGFPVFYIARL